VTSSNTARPAKAGLRMRMVDCFAANKCYLLSHDFLLPISPAAHRTDARESQRSESLSPVRRTPGTQPTREAPRLHLHLELVRQTVDAKYAVCSKSEKSL